MEDRKPKKSETSRELIPDDLVTVKVWLPPWCTVVLSEFLITLKAFLWCWLWIWRMAFLQWIKLAMLRPSNAKTSLTSSPLWCLWLPLDPGDRWPPGHISDTQCGNPRHTRHCSIWTGQLGHTAHPQPWHPAQTKSKQGWQLSPFYPTLLQFSSL